MSDTNSDRTTVDPILESKFQNGTLKEAITKTHQIGGRWMDEVNPTELQVKLHWQARITEDALERLQEALEDDSLPSEHASVIEKMVREPANAEYERLMDLEGHVKRMAWKEEENKNKKKREREEGEEEPSKNL